jgi:hypothetical protein
MRRIICATVSLWAMTAASMGFAQNGPVLLELYTSQGCSSCPPADEILGELAQRDDVIALSLHVDYWDYIGWADNFAQPGFGERQRHYARAWGRRSVYTPQMVIGGVDEVEGFHAMRVMDLIQENRNHPSPVHLTLGGGAGQVMVQAATDAPFQHPVILQLVRFLPQATVEISAGENAGQTMTYHNIVTSWQVVGTWDGRHPLAMNFAAPGHEGTVVIIQEDGMGRVLAVARR